MEYPLVNIHTHAPDSKGINILSMLVLLPGRPYPARPTLYSAGIHPWDTGWIDEAMKKTLLKELEDNNDLVAIGEIGMDYSRDIGHAQQQQLFEDQLGIAQRRKLPVIIHCVRAFEPVMKILSGYNLAGVIFHGFTGNSIQALAAVRQGYYLSFGERSLDSEKAAEAMQKIPRERIFLETDASEMTIKEIYEKAASILDISEEGLARIIYGNYKTLFG